MKSYRILNMSDGGRLATPLHFLDRGDAQRYFKIWAWTWQPIGSFLASDGQVVPLDQVELKIEPHALPALWDADLDWVLMRKDKALGYCVVIPGRCFDPEDWRPVSEAERRDPLLAPKIAQAELKLDEALNKGLI